jgi:hypothetical protein
LDESESDALANGADLATLGRIRDDAPELCGRSWPLRQRV